MMLEEYSKALDDAQTAMRIDDTFVKVGTVLMGNSEQVELSVCGLYVVVMWSVYGWYVVGMWSVCGWYVVGMWSVRGWYVVGTWSVCGQ